MLWVISALLALAGDPNFEKIHQMYQEYRKDFGKVPEIQADELSRQYSDYILIDVRDEKEQEVSMLPGAIRDIDFAKNPEPYKSKKLVAYCTIGSRSGHFAMTWTQRGYSVLNLVGGVLAWSHEKQRFVSDKGPTSKVHVYGRKWNLLSPGYSAVY